MTYVIITPALSLPDYISPPLDPPSISIPKSQSTVFKLPVIGPTQVGHRLGSSLLSWATPLPPHGLHGAAAEGRHFGD